MAASNLYLQTLLNNNEELSKRYNDQTKKSDFDVRFTSDGFVLAGKMNNDILEDSTIIGVLPTASSQVHDMYNQMIKKIKPDMIDSQQGLEAYVLGNLNKIFSDRRKDELKAGTYDEGNLARSMKMEMSKKMRKPRRRQRSHSKTRSQSKTKGKK